MDIYDRIKHIRKIKKLSQTEFGERVGVSRSVVRNIEAKIVKPKDLFVKQICKEYHVNYHWLAEGRDVDIFDNNDEILLQELAEEYKMDDLDKKIIQEYIQFSHDGRMVFKNFLEKLFKK